MARYVRKQIDGRKTRARPTVERFWPKVAKSPDGGCWNWTAAKTAFGYGKIYDRGSIVGAHCFSFELANGPIPAGMWVLHRCDNPACVNPAHLFLGTSADNVRDMDAKGRRRGWSPRGESNPAAKLKAYQVNEIRDALAAKTNRAELARRYSVSPHLITAIAQGKVWRSASPA